MIVINANLKIDRNHGNRILYCVFLKRKNVILLCTAPGRVTG